MLQMHTSHLYLVNRCKCLGGEHLIGAVWWCSVEEMTRPDSLFFYKLNSSCLNNEYGLVISISTSQLILIWQVKPNPSSRLWAVEKADVMWRPGVNCSSLIILLMSETVIELCSFTCVMFTWCKYVGCQAVPVLLFHSVYKVYILLTWLTCYL